MGLVEALIQIQYFITTIKCPMDTALYTSSARQKMAT